MSRDKIETKMIENSTNRQVTYSKRRNGIFKKAHELTVLCDAEVSIIMMSSNSKIHEYISPSTTTKRIYDMYQQALGIDLWSEHYDRMQESLRKLKEINYELRRNIRQRMGQDLNGLNYEELRGLEQKMQSSVEKIRERKYQVLKNRTDTYKKRVKSSRQAHGNLILQLETNEDPQCGTVENGEDYEPAMALSNGASTLYALHLQQHNYPANLHQKEIYGPIDLRLNE